MKATNLFDSQTGKLISGEIIGRHEYYFTVAGDDGMEYRFDNSYLGISP
jgi:hypothetical protein